MVMLCIWLLASDESKFYIELEIVTNVIWVCRWNGAKKKKKQQKMCQIKRSVSMKRSSYRWMRTLINVFRRIKSLVSKAFVILTDDVNSEAPQTIDKLDAFIKLCSRFASTLQEKRTIFGQILVSFASEAE